MNHWYIKIGVFMNQEELAQVKQDIEKLVSDVKRLVIDDSTKKMMLIKKTLFANAIPVSAVHMVVLFSG
jgi:hypothetical protein